MQKLSELKRKLMGRKEPQIVIVMDVHADCDSFERESFVSEFAEQIVEILEEVRLNEYRKSYCNM